MATPRILLVDMPFAAAGHPSLGLGSLQAVLRALGADCDALYANVSFARELGSRAFARIALDLPHPVLAGEWAFAACLYDGGPQPAGGYVDDVLRGRWRMDPDDVDLVRDARSRAAGFVHHCLRSVDWRSYDVIGFTSSSAQNVASLALARRVKELHAGALVVFGGSNWDEGMGAELHRRFPFVDVAVSGEAEESLPALVRWSRRRPSAGLRQIPGICYRAGGRTVSTGPARPVADLDALPLPQYDDYFEAVRVSGLSRRLRPSVHARPVAAAGGPPGTPAGSAARPAAAGSTGRRRPGKVLAELRSLAANHQCHQLSIVDDVPSPGVLRRGPAAAGGRAAAGPPVLRGQARGDTASSSASSRPLGPASSRASRA